MNSEEEVKHNTNTSDQRDSTANHQVRPQFSPPPLSPKSPLPSQQQQQQQQQSLNVQNQSNQQQIEVKPGEEEKRESLASVKLA